MNNPANSVQYDPFASIRQLATVEEVATVEEGAMEDDKLQELLKAADCKLREREVCGFCWHPKHEGAVCECTRTVRADGIEIDGPCGCKGEEIGYGR